MEPENDKKKRGKGEVDEEFIESGRPNRFSAHNQPSSEAKKNGWKRKQFGRNAIKALLSDTITNKLCADDLEKMKNYFGEELVKSESAGILIAIAQIKKAILTGDTSAFNALMDQSLGRPVQAIAQVDSAGNDLPAVLITAPKGFSLGMLPSNTDGNDSPSDDTSNA